MHGNSRFVYRLWLTCCFEEGCQSKDFQITLVHLPHIRVYCILHTVITVYSSIVLYPLLTVYRKSAIKLDTKLVWRQDGCLSCLSEVQRLKTLAIIIIIVIAIAVPEVSVCNAMSRAEWFAHNVTVVARSLVKIFNTRVYELCMCVCVCVCVCTGIKTSFQQPLPMFVPRLSTSFVELSSPSGRDFFLFWRSCCLQLCLSPVLWSRLAIFFIKVLNGQLFISQQSKAGSNMSALAGEGTCEFSHVK